MRKGGGDEGEREREEGGAKGEGTGMIFLSQQVCV